MSVITDIAEAVKDALNGGTFSLAFTAERHYQPLFELPEMKTLHVTVVPKSMVVQSGARDRNQHDYQVDIAVQKKLDAGDNAEIDPTKALVVVVEDQGRRVGLVTDELLGQQQIVIKSLGETLQGISGLAGGAIMPDGKVGLILDVGGLVKIANSEGEIARTVSADSDTA